MFILSKKFTIEINWIELSWIKYANVIHSYKLMPNEYFINESELNKIGKIVLKYLSIILHRCGEEIEFSFLLTTFRWFHHKKIVVYYPNLLVKQSKIRSLETKNRFLHQEGDSNLESCSRTVLFNILVVKMYENDRCFYKIQYLCNRWINLT